MKIKYGIMTAFIAGAFLIACQDPPYQKTNTKPKANNNRKFVKIYQHAYQFGWLNYLLYIPKDYPEQAKKEYPLILYFHGVGQRGQDPENLKACCLNKQLEEDKKENFPYIVVSPQLPGKLNWGEWEAGHPLNRATWWSDYTLEVVNKLLDHLLQYYAIDRTRLYSVGASMGGFGTWKMAAKFPDRFAAIAPLCGEGEPDNACDLKEMPIWIFHGDSDEVMPVENSDKMVEALRRCGGAVTYDRNRGGNHESCWANQFDNLYEWLLMHKKD